jgi:putative DNA primase/helicase
MKKPRQELTLIATAEDKATKDFFAVIRYRDIRGARRKVNVPLAELSDLNVLKKLLTNAGAYFTADKEENLEALRSLRASMDGAPHWVFARSVGWFKDQFVRPHSVIGIAPGKPKLNPPRKLGAGASEMRTCGTLEGWRSKVADPAKHSSRMVTAISAGFAAPLLRTCGMGSFALFFTGPSKIGKSTLTLAAGSVVGFGSEDALPNFRSTDAALGELPKNFKDHLAPLNEFGLLRGNGKERRQRQRELAYGLAEGRTTTYSELSPASESCGVGKYRSIIVANGEETSDELAMSAGEFRMAGECVRWMDVLATERDCSDVFDLAPKSASAGKRSLWFSRTCAEIRSGCKQHHGVALEDFISKVGNRKKTLRIELCKLRDAFVEEVTRGDSDQLMHHLAKNFGHLYAAGVLAVRLRTVPWSEELVLKCVRRCYRAARREIKTEAELLRRALKRLSARAKKLTILQKGKPVQLTHAGGFRREQIGQTTLTVRAEAFKTWFADPRQPRLVLECLQKQGRLSNRPNAPKVGHSIVWAASQPQWPDGIRRRSIVVTLSPGI